jgi:hypothetical protein
VRIYYVFEWLGSPEKRCRNGSYGAICAIIIIIIILPSRFARFTFPCER